MFSQDPTRSSQHPLNEQLSLLRPRLHVHVLHVTDIHIVLWVWPVTFLESVRRRYGQQGAVVTFGGSIAQMTQAMRRG